MNQDSGSFFYLIDHEGKKRVPTMIAARDGRFGYAVHPKGKGNDASAAEYTQDERRMVRAVVCEGRGVRAIAVGGPQDGQRNTLFLSGQKIRGYWICPSRREWVVDAPRAPEGA